MGGLQQGEPMLNETLSIFPKKNVHRLALVTSIVSNIMNTLDQEFAQEPESRDTAIDALISFISSYKGKPIDPVVPPMPQAPRK